MKKKINLVILVLVLALLISVLAACNGNVNDDDNNGNGSGNNNGTHTIGWDGESVKYTAGDIKSFGSGTPPGTANYNEEDNTVAIWNTDASLDNYGGIQLPSLTLDFSKAIIFQMEVVSCYSSYIVKLSVENEIEYYYVLSDTGETGLISVNVVDSMLSDIYRARNTQPDPGYATGWKYDGQKKNCAFHILAKGPDGEKQTAELVLKSVSIFNNQPAVTKVNILSESISEGKLEFLKGASSVTLSAEILPSSVLDKSVKWSSMDERIASIDQTGKVNFVGVGSTYIIATSALDRSKSKSVLVNVLSGFENKAALLDKLNTLSYQGSSADAAIFNDLYSTSWAQEQAMRQAVSMSKTQALDIRINANKLTIENYFDSTNSSHINEAEAGRADNTAYAPFTLAGSGSATIYRSINGKLYKEQGSSSLFLQAAYALYTTQWERIPLYKECAIVVWESGDIKKYEITGLATTLVAYYNSNDFTDTALWTIPDRTKQSEDPVIHALSPASIYLENNALVMKQNKYPEAKYCFGGIVSNVLTADKNKDCEIIVDIDSLNQMNDYVKTMWEVKALYYDEDKATVISSNPIKIESGNVSGTHIVTFKPAYNNFRIYLVVNGSDIGAQFADAQLKINSLKIYIKD